MIYGSVCSGIEAATTAWHPLGWTPAFFSEIEKFPRAVLQHHYPDVPLHGDFTTIGDNDYGPIDILVGGTPCQSFSIAGLRGGLDDDRGNLALEFLLLAQRKRPKWLVWENVPGVLSSDGGRDFGSILWGMVELGYGIAYRVLDAQHFGVPQRRRRVFVVGCLGDWRRAAAVLFERQSLSGDPAPRREKGENVAPTISARPTGGGGLGTDFDCDGGLITQVYGGGQTSGPREVAATLAAHGNRQDFDIENFVCAVHGTQDPCTSMDSAFALGRNAGQENVIATTIHSDSGQCGGDTHQVLTAVAVRRLTPRECERLQGFPDDYTQIPWRGKPADQCPDGPRYKALGNSMAVPVMAWIGERINQVEALSNAVA